MALQEELSLEEVNLVLATADSFNDYEYAEVAADGTLRL